MHEEKILGKAHKIPGKKILSQVFKTRMAPGAQMKAPICPDKLPAYHSKPAELILSWQRPQQPARRLQLFIFVEKWNFCIVSKINKFLVTVFKTRMAPGAELKAPVCPAKLQAYHSKPTKLLLSWQTPQHPARRGEFFCWKMTPYAWRKIRITSFQD